MCACVRICSTPVVYGWVMTITEAACTPFIKWKITHTTKRWKIQSAKLRKCYGRTNGDAWIHSYIIFSDMGILLVSKLCNTYNSIGCDAAACVEKIEATGRSHTSVGHTSHVWRINLRFHWFWSNHKYISWTLTTPIPPPSITHSTWKCQALVSLVLSPFAAIDIHYNIWLSCQSKRLEK